MGLNILDARITRSRAASASTPTGARGHGTPIADRHRAHEIEQQLWRCGSLPRTSTRPWYAPPAGADVLDADADHLHRGPGAPDTILELIAGDRRSALGGRQSAGSPACGRGHGAMDDIGERAETSSTSPDDHGRPLDEEARRRLQQKLIEALDRRDGRATRLNEADEPAPRPARPYPSNGCARCSRGGAAVRRPALALSIGEPRTRAAALRVPRSSRATRHARQLPTGGRPAGAAQAIGAGWSAARQSRRRRWTPSRCTAGETAREALFAFATGPSSTRRGTPGVLMRTRSTDLRGRGPARRGRARVPRLRRPPGATCPTRPVPSATWQRCHLLYLSAPATRPAR